MFRRYTSSAPKPAFISVDMDPIDRHLQGYGVQDAPVCHRVYAAVPRLLELADRTGVKLTFFFLGRDANAQRPLLREVVARGHEVASHSFNHPQPFRTLDDKGLAFELGASRASLTAACGEEVVGFRSPAWDVDERVFLHILASGYRYDASIFPSPAVLANRLSVLWQGVRQGSLDKERLQMSGLEHILANPRIHHVRLGSAALLEIPMATAPFSRAPFYHTLSYLVPAVLWRGIEASIHRSQHPMSYVLHGVDGVGLSEDGIDPRMAPHPGMGLPLAAKLDRLERTFQRLAEKFRSLRLRDALDISG